MECRKCLKNVEQTLKVIFKLLDIAEGMAARTVCREDGELSAIEG